MMDPEATDDLTAEQARVLSRVVDEEQRVREHVVVYLSGAHAYGFPSPDSDLDLKCIHVARTEDLLGLASPAPTFDRAEVIDGVEVDYTSNELAHALRGILAGNGNFIERVLGRRIVRASALLAELAPLVRGSLSRRVHAHYRGFALNQRHFLEKEPTAKKLLYVLRTTLTGIHLLRTGELEADLTQLVGRYGVEDVAPLIERKRAGERSTVDAALLDAWSARIDSLFSMLDEARSSSILPDEPANAAELNAWLVAARRASLTRSP
jgi:predicted nucleotidyltransferase